MTKSKAQYAKPKDDIEMGIHVSFGLSRDLSKEPRALVLFLEKPVKIADEERTKLDLELFGYDSSLAPAGKSVLKVLIKTKYSYWKELHKTPTRYAAEKRQVAATVLNALEKRFPGITDQVEVTDVPMTTERFTGIGQQFDVNWGLFGTLIFHSVQTEAAAWFEGVLDGWGRGGIAWLCSSRTQRNLVQSANKKA